MSISRRSAGFGLAQHNAEVAELADAHGSGPCTLKGVGVRVPSSAPASILSLRSKPLRQCSFLLNRSALIRRARRVVGLALVGSLVAMSIQLGQSSFSK